MSTHTRPPTTDHPWLSFVPGPLPLERRRIPRRSISIAAQAVQVRVPGHYQLLRLDLQDVSDCGFRALTDQPVAPGTAMRVRLTSNSPLHHATVVRCRPEGRQYDLGFRIAHPLAA